MALKVENFMLDGVNIKVADQEARNVINSIIDVVETKADISDVEELANVVDTKADDSRVDTLSNSIVTLGGIVDTKADKSSVTNLAGVVAGKQNIVSGVSDTEISYLDGVTENIQTQLNRKLESGSVDRISSNNGVIVVEEDGTVNYYKNGVLSATFNGKDFNIGNFIKMWVDNEGGNIEIHSGNGHTNSWQMDAYDGRFRIVNSANPFNYVTFSEDGDMYCKGKGWLSTHTHNTLNADNANLSLFSDGTFGAYVGGNITFNSTSWSKGTHTTYITKPTQSVYGQSYYHYFIPYSGGNNYNITLNDVIVLGYGSILSSCSIDSKLKDGFLIRDNITTGAGYTIQITYTVY